MEPQKKSEVMRSEDVAALVGALAKAQGEMSVPEKKRKATVKMTNGGTYEYKYADLSDIRAAVTPALSKNGLAITQLIDADSVRLTTLLFHESGQFLGSTYDLPRGLPAQQFGSALTYAKRYSLCSVLGVVAEEDDDAQLAQPATQRKAAVAKVATAIKPKGEQKENGTSGPNLEPVPFGMTRENIQAKISSTWPALTKLQPELDLGSVIYEKYGATNRASLTDEEAWDFVRWMEDTLKKGIAS